MLWRFSDPECYATLLISCRGLLIRVQGVYWVYKQRRKPNLKYLERFGEQYRVAELQDSQDAIEEWFNTPFASRILEAQQACCKNNLSDLAGYRLAHLGVSPSHDLLDCFSLRHGFKLASSRSKYPSCSGIAGIASFEELPLPSEVVDVLVLHHVLDFSPNPHKVLNEAARTVINGGSLVVVGFNPATLFGLAKWPGVLLNRSPVWRYHSLRMSRVSDWLTLLGFELSHAYRGFRDPCIPESHVERLSKMLNVQHNAFYVLAARKRAQPLTPVGTLNWLPARLSGALAGSSQNRRLSDSGSESKEKTSQQKSRHAVPDEQVSC